MGWGWMRILEVFSNGSDSMVSHPNPPFFCYSHNPCCSSAWQDWFQLLVLCLG